MTKPHFEELLDLIKSLSKSEKRYFKIFSLRYATKGGNKHVRLFDIIDRLPLYDENKILKKTSCTKKQLNSQKSHLYELILRSLAIYNLEGDAEKKINKIVSHAKILFEKGLFAQCEKILLKAKHLAYQYEKYESLIEILSWERRVLVINPQGDTIQQKKDAIQHEKKTTLKKIQNTDDYIHLADNIYSFIRTKGILRSENELQEFKNLINHVLLKKESQALTKEARRSLYSIYALFYQQVGDLAKSYDYFKKIAEMVGSSPEQIKEHPHIYLFSLNNLGLISHQLARYDELALVIEKIRTIPEKLKNKCKESIKVKIFEQSYHL